MSPPPILTHEDLNKAFSRAVVAGLLTRRQATSLGRGVLSAHYSFLYAQVGRRAVLPSGDYWFRPVDGADPAKAIQHLLNNTAGFEQVRNKLTRLLAERLPTP